MAWHRSSVRAGGTDGGGDRGAGPGIGPALTRRSDGRARARFVSAVCLVLAVMAAPTSQAAEDGGGASGDQAEAVPHTRRGADTCIKCHDGAAILSVFRTRHAEPADPDSPFADLQCESCHGPGGEHGQRVRRGETRPPILNFGSDTPYPAAEQNAKCLDCHDKGMGGTWHSGVHDRQDVSCADCHTVHAARDDVLVKDRQAEVCQSCHTRTRSEFQRAFTHPVRFGQMACSDCHAPHDALTPGLLQGATLNDTCYGCHAEKRGPFLWEHMPVSEDCSLCHQPHGSNHRWLLTKERPLLCQDCHSRAGHPSVAYTGNSLPGRNPSQFVVGGSCSNCHSRAHGSNHPSGAQLLR